MKLKKFLKIVKENCNDAACANKTCPFMGERGCWFVDKAPDDWDVKAIIKAAKKARKK